MSPFVIKDITSDQVWSWLGAGWRDMAGSGGISPLYGLVFVAVGIGVTGGLWSLGLTAAIPAAAGAFALLGPLLAVGLYEISRRREAGEPLKLGSIVFVKTASPGQIAFIGFVLLFLLLVWANAARLIFALFFAGDYVPLNEFSAYVLTHRDGLMLITVGTIVGGLIAFAVFSVSAVSLPLLMHRQADAVTAMILSVQAVRRNTGPMLLWAWIIAVTVAVGIATAFIGLAVAFPLLGHATWHAYRDLVDVKAVPAAGTQPAAPAPA